MFFRNTFFKEQLSVVASVRRENILALTIRVGMCVFLCSNKMKYHLFSLKRPCYTSNNKIYGSNPNILIELVYVSIGYLVYLLLDLLFDRITGTLITVSL